MGAETRGRFTLLLNCILALVFHCILSSAFII